MAITLKLKPIPRTINYEQIAYVARKFGAFITFGMDTFTGNTLAAYDPTIAVGTFAPTNLNVTQWAQTYKLAKMKYAILTMRLGGFNLWNTATTSYNCVTAGSPDIASLFVDAMRAVGIVPCFYISLSDIRYEYEHAGTDWSTAPNKLLYLTHIEDQLTELLTNYGPIGAIWADSNNWGWATPSFTSYNPGSTYYPFAAAGDFKTFVQGIQPNCLVVYDDHSHSYTSSDIDEYEIYSVANPADYSTSTNAITGANTHYAEEYLVIAAANQGGISGQGPGAMDQNYTLISASSILTELARVNACGGAFVLNAPPNQTGQIDSSIVSVLTTVGASL